MTGERLDEMVRDADPYRPAIARRLHGAEHSLLEEIMSSPTPRRGLFRRGAFALAAAAVLIAALAVSIVFQNRPEPNRATPEATRPEFSPVAMKAAEGNPRLLIGEPGWTAVSVAGFTEDEGTVVFRNGTRYLKMSWYPAADFAGHDKDRRLIGKPEAVEVDGWAGNLFRYDDSDFAVLLSPRDGAFAEVRTGGGWSRKTFDEVLGKVSRADVPTWLAALPPETVKPGQARQRAEELLAGVPLPPGFDREVLNEIGPSDPYQFAAEVTGRVGCAWFAEWKRADRAGDDAARQRATDALAGSRHWKVLRDMTDEGDWAEGFWDLADQLKAKGELPRFYAEGLNCD